MVANVPSNEDVSETMYRETLKTKEQASKSRLSQEQVENKVNRICDAFLAVLEQPQYKEAHLQNIITAHVCKSPPDLNGGLEIIAKLFKADQETAEKSAEHICFWLIQTNYMIML